MNDKSTSDLNTRIRALSDELGIVEVDLPMPANIRKLAEQARQVACYHPHASSKDTAIPFYIGFGMHIVYHTIGGDVCVTEPYVIGEPLRRVRLLDVPLGKVPSYKGKPAVEWFYAPGSWIMTLARLAEEAGYKE